MTAAYLINRTPSKLLKGKTPYELVFGKTPSYDEIRIFGCLCFARHKTNDKFASRSRKCVFVGYPFGKKGWKLYDLDTREFFVSRDVQFFEESFPFRVEKGEPVPEHAPNTLTHCPPVHFADPLEPVVMRPEDLGDRGSPTITETQAPAHESATQHSIPRISSTDSKDQQ